MPGKSQEGLETLIGGGCGTKLEELAPPRLCPWVEALIGGGCGTELAELAPPRLCPLTSAIGPRGSEEEEEAEEN